MKTKQVVDTRVESPEKINTKAKLKSLRPMRSMMAVRSFKPKTVVAVMTKSEEILEKN